MDKQYWQDYYSKHSEPIDPSQFALFVESRLITPGSLLELGCGNGRDTMFFAENKSLDILAIDESEQEIMFLDDKYSNSKLKFKVGDFPTFIAKKKVNNIYARFALHSITSDEEDMTIKNSYHNLLSGGLFFIEARSAKADLSEALKATHYRRLIKLDELVQKLEATGFKIMYKKESKGLAQYEGADPVIIRLIVSK